jgi:hypothetical protein
MQSQALLRRAIGELSLPLCVIASGMLAGCADAEKDALRRGESVRVGSRGQEEYRPGVSSSQRGCATTGDRRIRALPGNRVGPLCGPVSDSAGAVAVAALILKVGGGADSVRVREFFRASGGYLVHLQPAPAGVGGGGVFWVEPTGTVFVLQRSR